MGAVRLLCLILLFALQGCAVIAAGTGGGVVRGGIGALSSDPTSAELASILDDPALRAAAARLADATSEAALSNLNDAERTALRRQRSLDFVAALAPVMARGLDAEMGPVVRAQLVQAVHETVEQLSADRADIATFSAAVSRAVIDTVVSRMWAGVDREAGPATQKYLEEYLGPALRTVLERDVGPSFADRVDPTVALLVRTASHEVLAELSDALGGELGKRLQERQSSAVNDVNDLIEAREKAALAWAKTFGLLAGLGALVAGVLGWRLWVSVGTANQNRDVTTLLATMIKLQAEQDPAARALVRRIKRESQDSPSGKALKAFLDERQELKVKLDDSPEDLA